MIGPAEKTGDKIVDLLIDDRTLSLVTEDTIAREETDMVVDAKNGVLMGNLTLGTPSSFMIFAKDPRDDFKVMLDMNVLNW